MQNGYLGIWLSGDLPEVLTSRAERAGNDLDDWRLTVELNSIAESGKWIKPLEDAGARIRLIHVTFLDDCWLLYKPPAYIAGARLQSGNFPLRCTIADNPAGVETPHGCHVPDGLPIVLQQKPRGHVLHDRSGNYVYSHCFTQHLEKYASGTKSDVYYRSERVSGYCRFIPEHSMRVINPDVLTNPLNCPVCGERTVRDCGFAIGTRLEPFSVTRDITALGHRQLDRPIYIGAELAKLIERTYLADDLRKEAQEKERSYYLEPLIDESSEFGMMLLHYYKLFDDLRERIKGRANANTAT